MYVQLYENIGPRVADLTEKFFNDARGGKAPAVDYVIYERKLDESGRAPAELPPSRIALGEGEALKCLYGRALPGADFDPRAVFLVAETGEGAQAKRRALGRFVLVDVMNLHVVGTGPETAAANRRFMDRIADIVVEGYIETFYYLFTSHHLYESPKKTARERWAELTRALSGAGAAGGETRRRYADYVVLSNTVLDFLGLRDNLILQETLGIEVRSKQLNEFIDKPEKFLEAETAGEKMSDAVNTLTKAYFISRKRLLEYLVLQFFKYLEISPPDDLSDFVRKMMEDYRDNFEKRGMSFSSYLNFRLGTSRRRRDSVQIVVSASTRMQETMILLQKNLREVRKWKGGWKFVSRRLPQPGNELEFAKQTACQELGIPADLIGQIRIEPLSVVEEIKPSQRYEGTREIVAYRYFVYLVGLGDDAAEYFYNTVLRGRMRTIGGAEYFTIRPRMRGKEYAYSWIPMSEILSNTATIRNKPISIDHVVRKIFAGVNLEKRLTIPPSFLTRTTLHVLNTGSGRKLILLKGRQRTACDIKVYKASSGSQKLNRTIQFYDQTIYSNISMETYINIYSNPGQFFISGNPGKGKTVQIGKEQAEAIRACRSFEEQYFADLPVRVEHRIFNALKDDEIFRQIFVTG